MSKLEIQFLIDDQDTVELCKLYWTTDDELSFVYRVSDIAAQFGMPTRDVSKVVAQYCRVSVPGDACMRCSQPESYSSRSEFQQRSRWRNGSSQSMCTNCDRIIREERAREYQRQQQAEIEYKRKILQAEFGLENTITVDLGTLSLEDALYLVSFVRLGASEEFDIVEPILSLPEVLAPTPKLTYDILRRLANQRFIMPHPDSIQDAFIFEEGRITRYYLDRIKWALVFGSDIDEKKKTIQEVETILKNREWPDRWQDERQPIWKKVAIEECLAYLDVCMTEHKFSFKPGDKTYLVLDGVLEDYSIAQIYNFIWRATRDAAAYQVRQGIPRAHAANVVIGSIQKYAERALAEGWDVKHYRRDFRCPQSVVTSVLFNLVLQIGEAAFDTPPRTREY